MENTNYTNIEDLTQNNLLPKGHKKSPMQILIVIIILVLLFFIFKLVRTFNNGSIVPVDNVNQTQKNIVDLSLVNNVLLETTSQYVTVSGSYPRFTHVPEEFNTTIKDYVLAVQTESENSAQDNWKAMQETNTAPNVKLRQYPEPGDFYVDVKTDYIQVNENYISAIMRISAFSGGAHGYVVLYPINYDVVNKKVITIKDIMTGDANYLETLSTTSRAKLYAKLGTKVSQADFKTVDEYNSYVKDMIYSTIDDGTKPEEINFSNFTFDENQITIYFGEYQVASYVDGEQQITIPRK